MDNRHGTVPGPVFSMSRQSVAHLHPPPGREPRTVVSGMEGGVAGVTQPKSMNLRRSTEPCPLHLGPPFNHSELSNGLPLRCSAKSNRIPFFWQYSGSL
jgi:hypothetical protein